MAAVTSAGLLHSKALHWALLIVYFILLLVRVSYDLNRYFLFLRYYRNRHNRVPLPAGLFADQQLPVVTVQLPVYNERFVVDRLIDAICSFNYPREKLEIQVLDDSTDDTVAIARSKVDHYAALGYGIRYLHRENRAGYKAGALAAGMAEARGEFIAIFDADFVPPPDWLRKVVHYFSDPQIALVQTRWGHINRNYSLLTAGQAILLDGHFILEQGARFRSGLFFNFNGTGGIWRRASIEDAGGWQCDTLTEDTDLSYRALLKGWRFVYLQDFDCPAELPLEMTAFKTQQARWAKGQTQVAMKLLPRILKSNISLKTKIEAWFHLSGYLNYPLNLLLAMLLLPILTWFYQDWLHILLVNIPLFVISTFSVCSFYTLAERELFPRRWPHSLLYLPLVMVLGSAMTLTNCLAFLEALLKKPSGFVRTPKYRVVTRKDKPVGNTYRKRLGVIPWFELGLGAYFVLTVFVGAQHHHWLAVAFLGVLVTGYWYSALLSLFQGSRRFTIPSPGGRSRSASATYLRSSSNDSPAG
jgi:cellulose synthase/poly-beta-1,6-N-acetylglucosamine synthase-like glycosyltransferase